MFVVEIAMRQQARADKQQYQGNSPCVVVERVCREEREVNQRYRRRSLVVSSRSKSTDLVKVNLSPQAQAHGTRPAWKSILPAEA
jgi:hypothetical protein